MEGFTIKKTFSPISQLNQFPTKIPNPKLCFKLYLIINITSKLSLSASLLYIYARNPGKRCLLSKPHHEQMLGCDN